MSERLDEIHDPAALVDQDCVVRAVNAAWGRFAIDNGGVGGAACGIGTSYRAWEHDADDAEARRAAVGLLDVIQGRRRAFQMVYPCHSPTEERWFRLVVEPLDDAPPRPVLTVHVRLDARHGAREYRAVAPLSLPVVCAWCRSREKAPDGTWRPLRPGLDSTAVSHGICPGCVETFG